MNQPRSATRMDLSARTGVEVVLIDYINEGVRQDALVNLLERLVEAIVRLQETGSPAYRQIHLVGYSFGSLVALDAMFSRRERPRPRFQSIHTLVTIGCPFDLVRSFWPEYYRRRFGHAGRPERWINVYVRRDIMGS